MRELRFGVVGCGLMGREFASAAARWAHLLDREVRPVIVAACDTNPVLTDWFSRHVPSVRVVTANYRDLLDRDDIDAIYCAVPHHLHARIYVDAVRAGKHLLGEKPFGIDLAANVRINEAIAERSDVLVRVSSEFPFFPGAQLIARDALEGRFGRILEVEAGFLHSSDLDPNKPINWKRQVAFNGEYGCMGDLGLHVLHLPLRLGWAPRDVRALLSKVVVERPDGRGGLATCETWDNATLASTVEAGGYEFPMLLHTKRIAPGETNTWYLRVAGTDGSAEFSTKRPKTLRTLPYRPGEPQAWRELDLGYDSAYPTITGSIFEFGFTDAILQMWAAFCDEAAGREPPFRCATPQEAALSHRVFTAALESHAARSVVPLDAVRPPVEAVGG